MKLTYDRLLDALYVRLTNRPVRRTKRIRTDCLVDLDENDQVVGVEVLDVCQLGVDALAAMQAVQPTSDLFEEWPEEDHSRFARPKNGNHKRRIPVDAHDLW